MILEKSEIESTIAALEEAIKDRKIKMYTPQIPSGASFMLSHFFSEILKKAGGSYGQMTKALEHSGEFVQNFVKTTEQNIKERPWEVLRVVAVYSFGIGLFLSLRHRKSPTGKKE